MANISQVNLPNGTTYDIRDPHHVPITQAAYDALVEADEDDPNVYYYINDGTIPLTPPFSIVNGKMCITYRREVTT